MNGSVYLRSHSAQRQFYTEGSLHVLSEMNDDMAAESTTLFVFPLASPKNSWVQSESLP